MSMDQSYVTTEQAVNVIHGWCFPKTVEDESEAQKIREERYELERQQRLLENEKQEFLRSKEFEEKRMAQEKRLFEMKWKMLEDEWRKLVIERERVERKKSFYQRMEDFERSEQAASTSDISVSGFFKGVKNKSSLKKRYKDLIKIFHPDNVAGDTAMIQEINAEYEQLKKSFGAAG